MGAKRHMMLRVDDICQRLAADPDDVLALIDHEIIEPTGARGEQFSEEALPVAARALRLHQDLEMDWNGVAMALDLLDELQALRRENRQLRAELARMRH